MTNAKTARRWIVDALGEAAVATHFAAISTALDKVAAFGIARGPHLRLLGLGRRALFDLVGHRPAADDRHRRRELSTQFLAGAHAMDEHFRTAPLGREHADAARASSASGIATSAAIRPAAIIPYDQRLARFAGLSAAARHGIERQARDARTARPVEQPTGPLVWGEPGTNGQHAFYQLLHQGTDIIPAEFLIAAQAP